MNEQSTLKKTKLKDVPSMPNPLPYRREDDDRIYAKFNDDTQVPVKVLESGIFAHGMSVAVNPEELVTCIDEESG